MITKKSTFALFFGNRGFFPASHQMTARRELKEVLEKLGHEVLILDESLTRNGAVETPAEGRIYKAFLEENRGKFDGVILSLPNFGDETGAVAALEDAGVPILIQAYPDQMDEMEPAKRRDAFCGKFSVMDVFKQYNIPFTVLEPHVVAPSSEGFRSNVDYFDRLCRVVKNNKRCVIGAVGARTTAFKTVRIDELALQKFGVTVETFDLSDVFSQVKALTDSDAAVKEKSERYSGYTSWKGVPDKSHSNLMKLSVVLDRLIDENQLDAISIRCWIEMQKELGISPCVVVSELNDRNISAACEVDTGNALMMRILSSASAGPSTLLDWNNNYGDEPEKCILFHCGPVPQSMMVGKGQVTDHAILENVVGKGCSYGCNVGQIAPIDMTFGSLSTVDGQINAYIGTGRITDDPIPEGYFGCAGVAEIQGLQKTLQTIGYAGYRHHVALTEGYVLEPAVEAMEKYMGYDILKV